MDTWGLVNPNGNESGTFATIFGMAFSPSPGSVNRGYALAVFEYLDREGCDPASVFGESSVLPLRAEPDGPRLSVAQWAHLLAQAERALDDPAFPLKLAATIRTRHLGMLGFLVMSCDTLGDAARVLQRYEQLFDGINQADFSSAGETCTLTWRPLIERPPAAFMMLTMALWVHFARWLSERPDLWCDVHFTFARPNSEPLVAAFHATFGGRVCFEMPSSQLLIPASHLSLPIVHCDRHVYDALRERADTDLTKLLGVQHELLSHLEVLLAERLESGQISLEQMAQALSMSSRTLQNRLDRYGQTYREVLDRVRYRQAERHLSDPALTLAEVAVRLGFADQSSFQHAFKRWSGASPGEWRRRRPA